MGAHIADRTRPWRWLPWSAVWMGSVLIGCPAPLDAQGDDAGDLHIGVGLGLAGVTAPEGTVGALAGSARVGVGLSGTVALVLEGDIVRLIDGDPDPANFSGEFATKVFRTTHLLLSARVATSDRAFLRPGLGLGLHDREVGVDCDPLLARCERAERSTEGGYAAGLTWGYAFASTSSIGWSIELMTRVSDTEDGTRFTFGLLLIASLGMTG